MVSKNTKIVLAFLTIAAIVGFMFGFVYNKRAHVRQQCLTFGEMTPGEQANIRDACDALVKEAMMTVHATEKKMNEKLDILENSEKEVTTAFEEEYTMEEAKEFIIKVVEYKNNIEETENAMGQILNEYEKVYTLAREMLGNEDKGVKKMEENEKKTRTNIERICKQNATIIEQFVKRKNDVEAWIAQDSYPDGARRFRI